MTLQETIEQIHPLSKEAMDRAKAHWDGIAKPLHSLGKLEDVLIQIAGITGKEEISIEKRALLTFCADNGVVEENVTQSGQEVTATVAENFLQEKATAAILCRGAHADLFPIDIGMARDTKVPRYKVAYGTKNMAKGPAMTREEAVRALETGIAVAEEKIAAGYQLMATGEMGIGNTTTSSAMAAVFLNQPVPELTGRGAGLSSEGLARKIAAIEKAIAINQPDPSDPIDVLAKVGGFDIAGMAGCLSCRGCTWRSGCDGRLYFLCGSASCCTDCTVCKGLYDCFARIEGAGGASAACRAWKRSLSALRYVSGRGNGRHHAFPDSGSGKCRIPRHGDI